MEKSTDSMTDRPSEAPRVDFVSALPHLLGTLFCRAPICVSLLQGRYIVLRLDTRINIYYMI